MATATRDRTTAVCAVAGAVSLSVAAALTRPFTAAADTVTATALVAMLVVVGAQHRYHAPSYLARRPPLGTTPSARRWWIAWCVLLGAVAGWELFSYASSPRHEHPTLSSMLDALTAGHLGRGVAFAAWLAMGAFLVTR